MTTTKHFSIRDLRPGMQIDDLFVIADARQAMSRNGSPFWSLSLSDATGTMEAKIWSPLAQQFSVLAPGTIIRAIGQTDTYRDKIQLTFSDLEIITRNLTHEEYSGLVPVSAVPPEELYAELEDILRTHIKYKPWRTFVFKVLGDEDIRNRMLAAPGAKSIHHAYAGGLLEHSLAVTRICIELSNLYPDVDREVLLIGAAFHDIGKAWELTSGMAHDFSDQGRLLGHISLGMEVLAPYLDRVKSLEPELATHLKHLILSHHGELEYGSPKRPKTAEAMLLHFADMIDSKMNTVAGILDCETEAGEWSPYVRSLERFLYKPVHTPSTDARKNGKDKEPTQCLLPMKA